MVEQLITELAPGTTPDVLRDALSVPGPGRGVSFYGAWAITAPDPAHRASRLIRASDEGFLTLVTPSEQNVTQPSGVLYTLERRLEDSGPVHGYQRHWLFRPGRPDFEESPWRSLPDQILDMYPWDADSSVGAPLSEGLSNHLRVRVFSDKELDVYLSDLRAAVKNVSLL